MNRYLPWVLVLGRLGALTLLAPAYAAFSDDCATRLLLAQEWARVPFISAQIPWLPLPMILTGGVARITGLEALTAGLAINILLSACLPLFVRPLLASLPPARQAWALLASATLPWALYPGVSGLAEPLFWALSLGMMSGYLNNNPWRLMFCSALVCLTRYEGWILTAVLGVASVVRCHRQGAGWRPLALGLAVAPLAWILHQLVNGHLLLVFSVPMKDATRMELGGGGLPRMLVFFVLAVMAAPLWIFLLPFFRRGLKHLPRATWIFIILLYLVTTISGLGTALGQRNLVLPLILLLPALVAGAPRILLSLVVVVQMAALFHPERALNAGLQAERSYAVSCVREARRIFGNEAGVIIGQGAPGHAYLGRHVALRTGAFAPPMWVDQVSPPDKIRGETREKHMPFESFGVGPDPLISHWRSHKMENALAGLEPRRREEVLRVHDIRMILLPKSETWPRRHGFVRVGGSGLLGVWVPESSRSLDLRLPDFQVSDDRRISLREVLGRVQEQPLSRESFEALWQVFLW
ncbi:MAG: hypothetical protein AB7F75_00580 [Planctomycetota bacterium]